MGDVADMLGLAPSKQGTAGNIADETMKLFQDSKTRSEKLAASKQLKKPKGMKREVFDLLGKDGVLPAMQSSAPVTSSFMTKRTIAGKGKWVFDAIESSARSDGQRVFFHWVKADITYSDYPYAKFNVKLEKVQFTEEEYQQHLQDEQWSQEDTRSLLEACHLYDLRWPVIFDRVVLSAPKNPEDMQNRFYTVQSKLHAARDSAAGPWERKPSDFDVEKEAKRRFQQNTMYMRTRDEEHEELKLRDELKAIDAATKRSKKPAKATPAPAPAPEVVTPAAPPAPAAGTGAGDAAASPMATTLTNPLAEQRLAPQINRPALQSSRLYTADGSVPVAKSMMSKMNSYLRELHIPERPVPTKRVCDLVDQIRKDTITLISLHNSIKKKEKELCVAKGGGTKPQSKSQPKAKQDKQEKEKDKEKPEKPKKASSKKGSSAPVVLTPELDDPSLDPLNADLLNFDGKDEFGDLLDFDPNENLMDLEIKAEPTPSVVSKGSTSTKKRGRTSKAETKDEKSVEPPKKKTQKKSG